MKNFVGNLVIAVLMWLAIGCLIVTCAEAAPKQWYFAKDCSVTTAFHPRLKTLADIQIFYQDVGYILSEEKHAAMATDEIDMFSFRAVQPTMGWDFYVVVFNDVWICREVMLTQKLKKEGLLK
jgi:hypothetical protein